MTRSIHDMAYDPVRDEIHWIQGKANAILTFKGDANGNVPPLRIIMGPKTLIAQYSETGQRLCLDPVNHEIIVPDGERLLVFPQTAKGDVAPSRVLTGPDTQMYASACTVDPVHDLLMVSGRSPGWDRDSGYDRFAAEYGDVDVSGLRRTLDGNDSIGQISIFNRLCLA